MYTCEYGSEESLYEEYHGIHRNKIAWNPKIDHKKCINCGTCVEYCKLGVYDIKEEKEEERPVVTNPTNCVVFCTGCEEICIASAITHPSKKETRNMIEKMKKELL